VGNIIRACLLDQEYLTAGLNGGLFFDPAISPFYGNPSEFEIEAAFDRPIELNLLFVSGIVTVQSRLADGAAKQYLAAYSFLLCSDESINFSCNIDCQIESFKLIEKENYHAGPQCLGQYKGGAPIIT